jgi:hypothetical protein
MRFCDDRIGKLSAAPNRSSATAAQTVTDLVNFMFKSCT